jgi:uncharacterized protein (UPF0128 family)
MNLDLKNLSLEQLVAEAKAAKGMKKQWDDHLSCVLSEIVLRNNDRINDQLAQKDDPFGTVRVDDLKFTVPKAVIWDQEKLARLHSEISNAGDNPDEYMAVNYKVREAAFKNWPTHIQECFADARTVKQGTIKLELED